LKPHSIQAHLSEQATWDGKAGTLSKKGTRTKQRWHPSHTGHTMLAE